MRLKSIKSMSSICKMGNKLINEVTWKLCLVVEAAWAPSCEPWILLCCSLPLFSDNTDNKIIHINCEVWIRYFWLVHFLQVPSIMIPLLLKVVGQGTIYKIAYICVFPLRLLNSLKISWFQECNIWYFKVTPESK